MAITEQVPCPVCDEDAIRVQFATEHFAIGSCRGCGLIRQNPRYTAAHLRAVDYDGQIQKQGTFWSPELDTTGLEPWQSQPRAAYEAGVQAVEARRQRTGPRGLWLDVGASTGQLLVAARDAGWSVAGVEIGAGQVRICQEVHAIEVFHGTLEEAQLPDGHAEVVSYRHTLEHVHDVVGELTEACRVVQRYGLLLVEVPNYGGIKYQFGRIRRRIPFARNPWLGCNLPEHVYYFTPRTLTRLLVKTGFETCWWTTYGKTRRRPNLLRRVYDPLRDRLRIGNKLRLVARPSPTRSLRPHE